MQKCILLLFVLVALKSLPASAQKQLFVERESVINVNFKKGEKRTFPIFVSKDDAIDLAAESDRSLNLKITDPNGETVYQNIVKSKPVAWQAIASVDGSYIIEIESTALFFKTTLSMTLKLGKPDFSYGHFSSGDSLISDRGMEVLMGGELEIRRNSPRTYTYGFEIGDTLFFSLTPLKGKRTSASISNDLGELVFADWTGRKELHSQIPILQSGVYTIELSSTSYLPEEYYLEIEKVVPQRLAKKAEPEQPSKDELEAVDTILYDTIPETYLDTIFFVGANRDIINPSTKRVNFIFDNPSSVAYWFVFYGSGKEFETALETLNTFLAKSQPVEGAFNVLSAYGMGILKKLPEHRNPQIRFITSPSIQEALRTSKRSNYARLNTASGNHYLEIVNDSKSSGYDVYVQAVLLRKVTLETP